MINKIKAKLSTDSLSLLTHLLVAIQFIVVLDFVIIMPLGPHFLREFNVTPGEFAIIVSSYTFAAGFSAFLGSFFIDKFDKRTLLNYVFAGFVLGTFLCGFSDSFLVMSAARVFTGIFGGILPAIVFSLVGDLYPKEQRGTITGTIMTSFPLATIFGIPMGLFLASHLSINSPFICLGLLSLPLFIPINFLIPSTQKITKTEGLKEDILSTLSILKNKNNIRMLGSMLVINMSGFILFPFVSAYMVKNMLLPEAQLPTLYLISGVFTYFSSKYIGRLSDRFTPYNVFRIVAVLAMIPIFVLTNFGPTPAVIIIIANVLFMVLMSGRFIPIMTMLNGCVTTEERGRFISLSGSVRSIGAGIASLTAGYIVTTDVGVPITGFENAGYISIGAAVLVMIIARKIDTSIG